MERNFKNYIVWEEPDADRLDVSSIKDEYNFDEIENLFDVELSTNLVNDRESLLLNSSVQINCESSGGSATVELLIFGTPPYILNRDGTEIESEIEPGDFPYVDANPNQTQQAQEICYEIEDDVGDSHEVCCIVQP